MAASHLSGGRVNLAILREAARKELLECLDKCDGTKAVVWDEQLTGPFGLIAEYSLLKEHEVDKMFQLRPGRMPAANVNNIIFLCRPKLALMEIVAQNILKEEETGGSRKEFHIFFVPRKSLLCEQKLKELGVYGTFSNVDEYTLDLIPFDSDLLSMEIDSTFRDCYLEDDMTSMYYAAKSLMSVQALYGIIPTVCGKGDCARHVADMMLRMRRELAGTEPQITPQIDCLLLLDRTVDLMTPLPTQLTYEGLIDEIFGINNTSVKLPPEKFASSKQQTGGPQEMPTEPKKLVLNSAEELYAEARDRNFHAIGPLLSRKAKLISAQFEERHGAKTVGEIKQFVSRLPHMQAAKISLANHTTIAEMIKEVTDSDHFMESLTVQQEFLNGIDTDKVNPYIEDCIARKEPIIKILRLVCIQSVANNGMKQKTLDYYKREILQNPNDISYVFSGYAPLSVRLAQFLARPGWRSIEEVLRILPGPTFEEAQRIPVGLRKKRTSVGGGSESPKVTLVYFLGGVTYAEIAALRFLSQQEDSLSDYIIATTKIINGHTWLEGLMDTLCPAPFPDSSSTSKSKGRR
uniref:Vacuolar protein sorting-associated protein 33A n=1 Tax=Branchiostoma floridae TaxID=7739 RepID=C3XVT2_BRAFL|eukprot:XP_002611866.1 hypothetical protein BRAFLDRAFT_123348 [Branchiostoma floridae]